MCWIILEGSREHTVLVFRSNPQSRLGPPHLGGIEGI